MNSEISTSSSQAMPRDATEEQLRQYYNNATKDYDKVIIFIYLFHIINKCLQHTQLLYTDKNICTGAGF